MHNKELVQIENISVEELTELVSDKLLQKVSKHLDQLVATQNEDELLTREETAKLLKVSLSSLWQWTKKGKLIAYGIGNRVYYKRGEVIKALIVIN